MLKLRTGQASIWEMTKMAFSLGMGEANVAKSVTSEQAQATKSKLNHSVANSVDS
jgi:hypothetical protein